MVIEADFASSLSYALFCLKCNHIRLKDKQVEALKAVCDGNDVAADWIKSVCYQAPPFLYDCKLKSPCSEA